MMLSPTRSLNELVGDMVFILAEEITGFLDVL
jgi:hypothetical protein